MVDNISQEYFEEPKATLLEQARDAEKAKGKQMTYGCFNCIYPQEGVRVKCRLGHSINPSANDGGMDVISVLAGRSGHTCKACKEFVDS